VCVDQTLVLKQVKLMAHYSPAQLV